MKALLERIRRRWTNAALARADALAAEGRTDEALRALRGLSTADFAEVLLDPPERFPALAAALPAMPSEQVQRDWTGTSGRVLQRQTATFAAAVERAFPAYCGRPLAGATILDYGCGWGRILRLMYRYSDPSRIYGVDAWEPSLAICRDTRVLGNLALCDEVPRDLPFPGVTFDLVYAFSIFTHLSERTADAVLAAIRPRLRKDGLLVVTVRPVEYWGAHTPFPPGMDAGTMAARHRQHGFAFLPHTRAAVDGDITFGDTSIALDYVRARWKDWHLAGEELNRVDPYQVILFLRPR